MRTVTQELRKFKIAALNARLHQNAICPGNHDTGYYNGWYTIDGETKHFPEVTAKAKELYENPEVRVGFQERFNTYTFIIDPAGGYSRPSRGEIEV